MKVREIGVVFMMRARSASTEIGDGFSVRRTRLYIHVRIRWLIYELWSRALRQAILKEVF